jgi:hypothetical protein
MEENTEWRRPTAEELKCVQSQTKISTDYVYEKTKIYKFMVLGCLAVSGISLVLGSDKELSAVIILLVMALIFAGVIISRSLKTRFMLKSSDAGKVWVRELVVVSKESYPPSRRHREPSYIIHARIIHSDESSENTRRTYHIPGYLYDRLCKGAGFLDVRYDDDLSGNPFLIIEQIWNVEQ